MQPNDAGSEQVKSELAEVTDKSLQTDRATSYRIV